MATVVITTVTKSNVVPTCSCSGHLYALAACVACNGEAIACSDGARDDGMS